MALRERSAAWRPPANTRPILAWAGNAGCACFRRTRSFRCSSSTRPWPISRDIAEKPGGNMPTVFVRFALTLITVLAMQGAALAATRIKLLYTASPPFLGAFVAQDQGFFRKRGLD